MVMAVLNRRDADKIIKLAMNGYTTNRTQESRPINQCQDLILLVKYKPRVHWHLKRPTRAHHISHWCITVTRKFLDDKSS